MKTLEEREAFLQMHGIEYFFNLKESISLHQRNDYLRSIADQWNRKFYDPIIRQVQLMELDEARKYLKSKGIRLGKSKPLEAIAKHRQKAIITNTDVENAMLWNEKYYDSLYEHIAKLEGEGATREELANFLKAEGIRLEPALEFEELVQRQKGQDFMNEIFEFKQGKAVGIKRDAVLHLISQFKILKSSI